MIRHQSQSIRHMSVDVLDECEIPLTPQRPNVHLSAQRLHACNLMSIRLPSESDLDRPRGSLTVQILGVKGLTASCIHWSLASSLPRLKVCLICGWVSVASLLAYFTCV